ncbi:MAG: hypothetical protein ABIP81_03885, partial [Terriglobales bacterium]
MSRINFVAAIMVTAAAALLTLSAVSAAVPAEDKQLTVYAPQATFNVRVSDHENREYADWMAVAGPLSRIQVRIDGNRARFTGGAAEGEFIHGQDNVRVGKNRVRFPGKVIIA